MGGWSRLVHRWLDALVLARGRGFTKWLTDSVRLQDSCPTAHFGIGPQRHFARFFLLLRDMSVTHNGATCRVWCCFDYQNIELRPVKDPKQRRLCDACKMPRFHLLFLFPREKGIQNRRVRTVKKHTYIHEKAKYLVTSSP